MTIRLDGGIVGPMMDPATDGTGEGARVAFLDHGRNQGVAEGGGVRHGRAGHAGKQHRGDHVGMGEAAAKVTHQRICKGRKLLGDTRAVHDFSGQDKKGHGHEREEVQPFKVAFGRHRQKILSPNLNKTCDAGHTESHPNGKPQENEEEKDQQNNDHDISLLSLRCTCGGCIRPSQHGGEYLKGGQD